MLQRLKNLFISTAFVAIFPTPGMSEGHVSFEAQVRAALLANPDIILEVFAILEDQQNSATQDADLRLIQQNAHFLFNTDQFETGPVLVEFVDYQCGYCRASTAIVAGIMEQFPDAKLHLIQLPILGPKSTDYASKMLAISELYGGETYIKMNEIFLGLSGAEIQSFDLVLAENGLSPQRVYEVSQSERIREELANNLTLAKTLGINGTPGFVTRSQIIHGFVEAPVLVEALFGS